MVRLDFIITVKTDVAAGSPWSRYMMTYMSGEFSAVVFGTLA